jgi:hypothetical protein
MRFLHVTEFVALESLLAACAAHQATALAPSPMEGRVQGKDESAAAEESAKPEMI